MYYYYVLCLGCEEDAYKLWKVPLNSSGIPGCPKADLLKILQPKWGLHSTSSAES